MNMQSNKSISFRLVDQILFAFTNCRDTKSNLLDISLKTLTIITHQHLTVPFYTIYDPKLQLASKVAVATQKFNNANFTTFGIKMKRAIKPQIQKFDDFFSSIFWQATIFSLHHQLYF